MSKFSALRVINWPAQRIRSGRSGISPLAGGRHVIGADVIEHRRLDTVNAAKIVLDGRGRANEHIGPMRRAANRRTQTQLKRIEHVTRRFEHRARKARLT